MRLLTGHKSLARACVLALFLGVAAGGGTGGASGATSTSPACTGLAAITSVKYTGVRADGKTRVVYGTQKLDATFKNGRSNRNLHLPGVLNTKNKIKPGDTVTATFIRKPGCAKTQIGIATYRTLTNPSEGTYAQFLAGQRLYDSRTTTTKNSLTVKVPMVTGASTPAARCTNKHLASDKTYNGNGGDSASGNQYASTCDGSPSQNGRGDGNATNQPCAGCVGNADNKNPPGQAPNGTDANAGYECDRNQGVGRSNPAHTGCATKNFQFDLFTGPVLKTLSSTRDYFGPPKGPSISFAWNVG